MTMTRLKISKTLLAVMLTSAVATGSAYAENNAQTTNESAGQKVDSSMNKVGNFMDDSAITAKVKAALVDHDNIKSTDISVKTDQKVVTLSGFITSYNDMLSAHQPYEHYPEIIRKALHEANAVGQVAGGVPAMCKSQCQIPEAQRRHTPPKQKRHRVPARRKGRYCPRCE